MTDFFDSSMRALTQGLRRGALAPLDIAEAVIERTRTAGDTYRVWSGFDPEVLRAQAREAKDRLDAGKPVRPLEAMPVAVKDIFNTVAYPTEMGSPLWAGFTPGNDARAVYNLKRAGAMVAGKTTTAEFAVHYLPDTYNPHDVLRNPGTSSTGSAVATALAVTPMALGTQTAGSIVRPASFCGVWGCKPSYGLIPRTGVLKTTDTLDSIGFYVVHAEDLGLALDAVRVSGRDYPMLHETLEDPARQAVPQGRKWKVAFARTHTWDLAPGYARAAMEEWVARLSREAEVEVVEIDLPAGMERCHDIHEAVYHRCLAYYFQQEYKSTERLSPIMQEIIAYGQGIPDQTYRDGLAEQSRLAAEMDSLLAGYDAMVSLSTAGEAPPREVTETRDPALMWTMTWLPVVSAPAFTGPTGLPFGAQLVARRYNDHRLFRLVDHLVARGCLPAGPNPRVRS
ncbi:amidase [Magnetospirillum sp. UT-4]|uniref:amidase n=1 Tax=Magnetospirillum sp. UT-4 TaxID=2681467 RepID=UPI001573B60E|nr:amidase [Magnetospirillum sp. UT-4]